jgi:glycogen(starch) synthase
MASGCPCIVADTGGLREVVPNRDVGLRFRAESPRSLAHWVARVLTDDDLRDRLVTEASVHVRRFDWAEIAVQTAGLYGHVVTGATRRGPRERRVVPVSQPASTG